MSRPGARPTLGVLVSNYDTWNLTQRCLAEVVRHGEGIDAVLVVDDASAKAPPAPLGEPRGEGGAPPVRVLVNERNLGLPATLNRGLREIGTDLVAIFDSDAYPQSAVAGPVRDAFEGDPRLAVLGFETVDQHGRPTGSWEREPGVASLVLGQRLHRAYLRLIRWWPARRITVYSCAMAVRRSAVLEAGGFDESLDWLDLDHDLCMRMQRTGWRVARTERVRAFHEGAGSPQAVSQRVYRFYKARWRLLRKLGKIRRPRPVRALVLLRLRVELAFLKLFGTFLVPDPDRRRDTLAGRLRVIRYCREKYR